MADSSWQTEQDTRTTRQSHDRQKLTRHKDLDEISWQTPTTNRTEGGEAISGQTPKNRTEGGEAISGQTPTNMTEGGEAISRQTPTNRTEDDEPISSQKPTNRTEDDEAVSWQTPMTDRTEGRQGNLMTETDRQDRRTTRQSHNRHQQQTGRKDNETISWQTETTDRTEGDERQDEDEAVSTYLCACACGSWGSRCGRRPCRSRGRGRGRASPRCARARGSPACTWPWRAARPARSPARNTSGWPAPARPRAPPWCAWRSRAWCWRSCCRACAVLAVPAPPTDTCAPVWWGGPGRSGRRPPRGPGGPCSSGPGGPCSWRRGAGGPRSGRRAGAPSGWTGRRGSSRTCCGCSWRGWWRGGRRQRCRAGRGRACGWGRGVPDGGARAAPPSTWRCPDGAACPRRRSPSRTPSPPAASAGHARRARSGSAGASCRSRWPAWRTGWSDRGAPCPRPRPRRRWGGAGSAWERPGGDAACAPSPWSDWSSSSCCSGPRAAQRLNTHTQRQDTVGENQLVHRYSFALNVRHVLSFVDGWG